MFITLMQAVGSWHVDILPLVHILAILSIPLATLHVLGTETRPSETHQVIVASLAGVAAAFIAQVGITLGWRLSSNSWASGAMLEGWQNRNTMALVFTCALVYSWRLMAQDVNHYVNAGFAIILLLGVAATYSRSGYLACVSALIILFWTAKRPVLAVASMLPLLVIAFLDPVQQRIQYTTSTAGGLDPSSAMRLDLWDAAHQIIIENPIIGVGIFGIMDELRDMGFPDELAYAHNSYLTLLASFGLLIPGLLAVVAIFSWQRKRSQHPADPSRRALLGAAAVSSVFGEPLLVPTALVIVTLLVSRLGYRDD